MANTNVFVSSNDSYEVWIDSGGASSSEYFLVEHGTGPGATSPLLKVEEDGTVTVNGPMVRSGDVIAFNSTYSSGNAVSFKSAGVEKAGVGSAGLGDFSTGGVRLPVRTSTPDTVLSGSDGDLVLWDDTSGSGYYKLCMCVGGTSWRTVAFNATI